LRIPLLLAASILVVPAAAQADDRPPTAEHVDQLFVQSAAHGTLTPVQKAGRFQLVLDRVAARTKSVYCCVWNDQHQQVTELHTIPTADFVSSWGDFGFASTSPGAVLSLAHGKRGADSVALRLTHPRLRRHGTRLVYDASVLPKVEGNLKRFAAKLDRSVPRRFGASSLSISQESAPYVRGCTRFCGSVNGCVLQPYTQCPGRNLQGASIYRIRVDRSNFAGASFNNAKVTYSDFSYSDFTNAGLYGATLENTSLEGSKFPGADLQYAKAAYAIFLYADLSTAHLANASLISADLESANLTRADLRWADLTRAWLDYARFTNAQLADAYLNGALLKNTTFKGADLSRADLRGAVISHVDFTDANLTGARVDANWNESAVMCRTVMPNGSINNGSCP
jgi:uncharacterized protein YjbI with pentapeptide repeats